MTKSAGFERFLDLGLGLEVRDAASGSSVRYRAEDEERERDALGGGDHVDAKFIFGRRSFRRDGRY